MGEGRGRRGEGGKLIRALQSLWFSCTRFKRLPEAKFTGSKLAFKNRIRRHQRNQRPLREFRRASAGFYPFDHHSNSIPPSLLCPPPSSPSPLSLSLFYLISARIRLRKFFPIAFLGLRTNLLFRISIVIKSNSLLPRFNVRPDLTLYNLSLFARDRRFNNNQCSPFLAPEKKPSIIIN